MKLVRVHEITVICDSEQFLRAHPHEATLFASGRHFVNFRMTTLLRFFNFRQNSGIFSKSACMTYIIRNVFYFLTFQMVEKTLKITYMILRCNRLFINHKSSTLISRYS